MKILKRIVEQIIVVSIAWLIAYVLLQQYDVEAKRQIEQNQQWAKEADDDLKPSQVGEKK